MRYDVIIVGGSYAGLAAALQLARARRRILLLDEGLRRNRFASHSHGFLGRDGHPPDEIATEARRQVLAYPTVTWTGLRADRAEQTETGFRLTDAKGGLHEGGRLILATGVVDMLPPIPGLAERWGRSVFHCPYCHGYELDQGRIAVVATSAHSMHHALMLPDWGRTTLLLNGNLQPDDDQSAALERRGVTVEPTPVRAVEGHPPAVLLADGRALSFDGLFVLPRTRLGSPLAEQLGCALEQGPMGPYIRVDATQQTSIPGVFACGDTARGAGAVALAVADGTQAGTAAHRSLIFGMI